MVYITDKKEPKIYALHPHAGQIIWEFTAEITNADKEEDQWDHPVMGHEGALYFCVRTDGDICKRAEERLKKDLGRKPTDEELAEDMQMEINSHKLYAISTSSSAPLPKGDGA